MSNGLSGPDTRSSRPRGGATGRYLPWSSTNPAFLTGAAPLASLAAPASSADRAGVVAGAAAHAAPVSANAAARVRYKRLRPTASACRIQDMLLSSHVHVAFYEG